MKKGTIIAVILVLVVLIGVSVAIPALDEKVNEDFGSHSSSVSDTEIIEKELDPFVELIIDTASKKYIDLLARLVKDTLDQYFTEELGVSGTLVAFEDKAVFIATDNQYFSSLDSTPSGSIYARVQYSVLGAYTFDNNKNLSAFADAVHKCRAYSIGDPSVTEQAMKESFKTIALINDVDADLVVDIVSGAKKYQKLKARCYNKFRGKYEEMFRGVKQIEISASGRLTSYNDDKQVAFNNIEMQLLSLYNDLLKNTL